MQIVTTKFVYVTCDSRKYPYSLQGGLFEIPKRDEGLKNQRKAWTKTGQGCGGGVVQTKTKPSTEGWIYIFSGTTWQYLDSARIACLCCWPIARLGSEYTNLYNISSPDGNIIWPRIIGLQCVQTATGMMSRDLCRHKKHIILGKCPIRLALIIGHQ